MAGERKGRTYEALVKVALDHLKAKGAFVGEIFWNVKATGMTVTPDFTVGPDADHPNSVILVTHSGSAGDSHKKWWRNQGELTECKLRLKSIPQVFSVAFDSVIKDDLKSIGLAALDGQLIVGDRPYGPKLVKWIDTHHGRLPADTDEKVEALRDLFAKKDPKFGPLFAALLADMKALMAKTNPALGSLWAMERKRSVRKAPTAHTTYVRRGLSKLLIFEHVGQALQIYRGKPVLPAAVPQYAFELNLAKKAVGRASAADAEIASAVSVLTDAEIHSIFAGFDVSKIAAWLTTLRNAPHLKFMGDYVAAEYANLCDPAILLQRLRALHTDPWALVDRTKAPVNWPPGLVWLLEHLMEVIKADIGSSNGFGYAQLSKAIADPSGLCGAQPTAVRTFLLSPWGHLSEWIHRVPSKSLPSGVLECVALVVANKLGSISDIHKVTQTTAKSLVNNILETKLCAYSGFDPLATLIESSVPDFSHVRVRACYAEAAGIEGLAGVMQLGRSRGTVINWQSATDEGKDHKVKELCGRAAALRYRWDAKAKTFVPRDSVKKLCLVVDGSWIQEDLDTLVLAGWDEIFYPDEMDKLAKAIV